MLTNLKESNRIAFKSLLLLQKHYFMSVFDRILKGDNGFYHLVVNSKK